MTGGASEPAARSPTTRGTGRAVFQSLYRWALIGITVGVISGFVAVAFFEGLNYAGAGFLGLLLGIVLPTNGAPPTSPISWSTDPHLFLLLPALMAGGGLAVGLLTYHFAPEAAGHGTDQAIRAFHRGRGVVRWRMPIVKFLASILTLGTGGSGGREGPTAQIGAGLGSLIARPLGLSTQERRVALMTGVGAGIGAIFRAPFGAALLSSEILYISDFEPEVIMPAIVASVISYTVFGSFEGFGPEFAAPLGLGWRVAQLPLYALLGAVAGLLGILYVVAFRWSREMFERSSLPTWARPAVAAGAVGLLFAALYYLVPQEGHFLGVGAIGIGYGVVQWLLYQGQLPLLVLVLVVTLVFVKILATSLTVGSGGSAGLFGPGIVVGAGIGYSVAGLMSHAIPGLVSGPDFTAFAIIGMMAFFGSVSKAPIAVILMVVEMTGSESLLVPAMMAIFIAYYVTGPYHLYSEQVPNRLASPTHTTEYFAEFLRRVPASAALEPHAPTIPPETTAASASFELSRSRLPVLAVVQGDDLVGEIRLADLLDLLPAERLVRPVSEVMRRDLPNVDPTTSLLEALGKMDAESLDGVLVFRDGRPRRLVGILTREAIAEFQRTPRSIASVGP